jgi:hypothetical protein
MRGAFETFAEAGIRTVLFFGSLFAMAVSAVVGCGLANVEMNSQVTRNWEQSILRYLRSHRAITASEML